VTEEMLGVVEELDELTVERVEPRGFVLAKAERVERYLLPASRYQLRIVWSRW